MSDLKDPRVLFAAERTLLAWTRTSLGLIAFGFLVERAGLILFAVSPQHGNPATAVMTFWLGLAFIVLGAFASAYSAWQYTSVLKTLNPSEFPLGYRARSGLMVNGLVAFLGAILAIVLYLGRV